MRRALSPELLPHLEGPVWIVAAGKAAPAMAGAAVEMLGQRVRGGLVVSAPGVAEHPLPPLAWLTGGHPTPTADSERAGRLALDIVRGVPADEAVLCLWSGGASALMAVPADGMTLEDKQRTTDVLLRSGADIHALNTVRKHLSAIKGGRLASAMRVPSHTLAISDVVGDDVSVIASGPTVADASTFQDALDALRAHGGLGAFPPRVVSRLSRGSQGALEETPKPGDARLTGSHARVIAGRHDAMKGAADAAAALGYEVLRMDAPVVGEARAAASAYLDDVARYRAQRAESHPLCVVSSGETIVRVRGNGRGGRNQEFALALVERLAGLGRPAALASIGTDGIDGPTDAAGAIADSSSAARARKGALDPSRALNDNDSHTFFAALGDLVRMGPTGTNVGDLQITLLA